MKRLPLKPFLARRDALRARSRPDRRAIRRTRPVLRDAPRPDTGRPRLGLPRRLLLAQPRSRPRRPLHRRLRRQGAPSGSLLWRDRGRALEDHRRRRGMVPGDGLQDHIGFGRRGCGRRNRPRSRLHRHGRDMHSRQHPARGRRLPEPRRGRDLGAHRLLRIGRDFQDPHPSHRSGHRLCGVVREVRRAERGAGCLPEHRRWRQLGAGSLPRRAHRRHRPRDRPQQPRRALRGALGGLPQGVHDVVGRAGQRHVQIGRWGGHLDRDHPQPRHADGRRRRQDRPGGVDRQLEPGLRPLRARRRGPLPLGRRGRDLGAHQRRAPYSAAGLLLHARLRGPSRRGRGVRPEHLFLPLDRRRGDLRGSSTTAPTSTSTTSGSTPTTRRMWWWPTTAAAR